MIELLLHMNNYSITGAIANTKRTLIDFFSLIIILANLRAYSNLN